MNIFIVFPLETTVFLKELSYNKESHFKVTDPFVITVNLYFCIKAREPKEAHRGHCPSPSWTLSIVAIWWGRGASGDFRPHSHPRFLELLLLGQAVATKA